MSIKPDALDWWFNTNKNVMLVGRHGVGKTAMIKACFERHGLVHNETYLYFSASTLDPWVDLIGCPKEVRDEEGRLYLDIVRPKNLYHGKIVAIFFDEFNRSPKKVRNAVMELLQFKSINGFRFPDLKCVWTAVNPESDDVYDVEKVDPAQEDRFHIIKEIPYECDFDFFVSRFGQEHAATSIEWWNALPDAEKNKISPRRLEYALDEFIAGGDVRDILPVSSNIPKLLQSLKNGSVETKIKSLFESKNESDSKLYLSKDNNSTSAVPHIIKNDDYMKFFLPLIHKEKLMSLLISNDDVFKHISKNWQAYPIFESLLQSGLLSKNQLLKKKIQNVFARSQREKFNSLKNKGKDIADSIPPLEPFKPTALRPKDGLCNLLSSLHMTNMKLISKKFDSYKKLCFEIPEQISKDECLSVLIFLNAICENSSTSTLLSQELHGLPNVANFLLSKLHKMAATQGFDFDEIINDPKYKSILLLSGVGLVNDFSESECI